MTIPCPCRGSLRLLILTDVPGGAVDFGKPSECLLRQLALTEFEGLLVHDSGGQATMCDLDHAVAGLQERRARSSCPTTEQGSRWRWARPAGDDGTAGWVRNRGFPRARHEA